MNPVVTILQYIKHRFTAKRWDSFHSPYLFRLLTTCCDDKNDPTIYSGIEHERNLFLNSDESFHRADYGAGSTLLTSGTQQKIADVAKHALSNSFQCRFLARLTQFAKANTVLEFGTSLGISGAYIASSRPEAKVVTIEGDPILALKSRIIFEKLGLENINCFESTFENYIATELNQMLPIDLLFLDGHHQSKALLAYFHALKHLFHRETVVVVDDIYWSDDMQSGWKEIISLPEVTQSVDCFHFGILFFKTDFLQRENHVIKLPLRSIFN